jgi:16S rRNA G966 N2-methylase RsmD
MPENKLYYGDNLDLLRRYVRDESVDLMYLDPPFQQPPRPANAKQQM